MRNAARLSRVELCRKYHNENIHTEHVTALTLQLFDEVRERFGFSGRDRALLEAAARLHDVAYSVNPRRHRAVSAEILLREGLAGFSDNERAVVAATMLLHSGDFRLAGAPQRAERLGAILRVADGLDFGHLQDARIVRIQQLRRGVRVLVRSPHFPRNLERAGQKADLWRAVFPGFIQFVPAPKLKTPAAPLIAADVSVLEASRRLLSRQFKIVVLNVDGALTGGSAEPLHDIRVAIRRLRAELRAFHKPLARTAAPGIDRALQQLNEVLGPARDADVWAKCLSDTALQLELKRSPRWRAFHRHQGELRRLQLATVRRNLSGPAFGGLRVRIGRLLRVQLPRLIATTPPGSLEKLARRTLRKDLRRALKLARLRRSKSPDDLHQLRIALRKARYLGEFFSPVLGPPVDELTRHMHAAEQMLGKIHDVDVGLARIAREGPPPPCRLAEHLEQRRLLSLGKLDKAWTRLERFAAQRDVRKKLKF